MDIRSHDLLFNNALLDIESSLKHRDKNRDFCNALEIIYDLSLRKFNLRFNYFLLANLFKRKKHLIEITNF